ncbi:MAG: divergent polysaccharide deacetylase family protein, partial [Sphingomonadales bacterium]
GGVSPLFLTTLVLAAGFAGLIGWLALTAEETPVTPAVADDGAEKAGEKADDTAAGDAADETKLAKPPKRLPLPSAPDPDLIEQGRHGPLPKPDGDGRVAWQVYARPFLSVSDQPHVAIVVGWLGLKRETARRAVAQLPEAVTLAFSPYAPDAQHWVTEARNAGHEVILQIPMEPIDYPMNDPGPHTLLSSLDPAANIDRLEWMMSRLTGYVGITEDMGSRFVATESALRPVLEVIRRRGLMYLDGRPTRYGATSGIARELALPLAINNRLVDIEPSRDAIDAQLQELVGIARTNGAAVGLAHAYPVTLERLAKWAETLSTEGVTLVPVTAVVNRQPEG